MREKIKNPKIGTIVRHTGWKFEHDENYPCDVLITGGQYMSQTGVSNFWDWRRVLPDGSLSKTEHGYGSFEKSDKNYVIIPSSQPSCSATQKGPEETGPTNYTFQTTDPNQVKRWIKSDDMAAFIFELVHNGWRKWKHDDEYDYIPAWEKIHELLDEFGIDVDDLNQ